MVPTIEALEARMDGCKTEEQHNQERNDSDHRNIFDRLGNIEVSVARIGVRVGVWAALGAGLAITVGGGILLAVANGMLHAALLTQTAGAAPLQ